MMMLMRFSVMTLHVFFTISHTVDLATLKRCDTVRYLAGVPRNQRVITNCCSTYIAFFIIGILFKQERTEYLGKDSQRFAHLSKSSQASSQG